MSSLTDEEQVLTIENGRSIVSRNEKRTMASYFGLAVEVMSRMASYSLIRYREQVSIVDTLDLAGSQCLEWGPLNNSTEPLMSGTIGGAGKQLKIASA
jgi:hypothetical protein